MSISGLDRLIQNYLENAQGLPAQLTQFCKCRTPPEEYRLVGVTNLLHRAVLESKINNVFALITHQIGSNQKRSLNNRRTQIKKSLETVFFDCRLSPVERQMAIELFFYLHSSIVLTF